MFFTSKSTLFSAEIKVILEKLLMNKSKNKTSKTSTRIDLIENLNTKQ
jgi:hypothetical protein